jgi:hypothetical protein
MLIVIRYLLIKLAIVVRWINTTWEGYKPSDAVLVIIFYV